eukprot:TRINITY_DN54415_c0_g1_i1.p1 TRINITY_DN54415_c0_g1~~TRINITY_DN54415_c0_g1_i1.p1  ORF type:complete len:360 (-),score=57.11 TRINITY_DN54415_c0_g1_i1:14-1093(-)
MAHTPRWRVGYEEHWLGQQDAPRAQWKRAKNLWPGLPKKSLPSNLEATSLVPTLPQLTQLSNLSSPGQSSHRLGFLISAHGGGTHARKRGLDKARFYNTRVAAEQAAQEAVEADWRKKELSEERSLKLPTVAKRHEEPKLSEEQETPSPRSALKNVRCSTNLRHAQKARLADYIESKTFDATTQPGFSDGGDENEYFRCLLEELVDDKLMAEQMADPEEISYYQFKVEQAIHEAHDLSPAEKKTYLKEQMQKVRHEMRLVMKCLSPTTSPRASLQFPEDPIPVPPLEAPPPAGNLALSAIRRAEQKQAQTLKDLREFNKPTSIKSMAPSTTQDGRAVRKFTKRGTKDLTKLKMALHAAR